MDVREKLVELLNGIIDGGFKWHSYSYESGEQLNNDEIASRLISYGVTVQEWISVADELPKKQGFYRVYHKNSKSICDRFYHKDCPDLFVNVRDDPITHWKPIEQPPKGEQNNE